MGFHLKRHKVSSMISLRRIYELPSDDDGFCILVDRLWPRGINKNKARIDLWLKDIAPSILPNIWFGHEPDKCGEFKKRYFRELQNNSAINLLRDYIKKGRVTLLYSAKDEKYNNAVALKEFLEK